MSWLARAEIDAVIRATLEEREIAFDQVGESAFVVRLMGTHRLVTAVRLVVGDQSLLIEAFFVRRPDENAQEFYRFLLERNGHMYGVHFAIDAKGDVYLMGRLPLLAVTPDEIDRLLGCVLTYADETFDAALRDRVRGEHPSRVGVAGVARRVCREPARVCPLRRPRRRQPPEKAGIGAARRSNQCPAATRWPRA